MVFYSCNIFCYVIIYILRKPFTSKGGVFMQFYVVRKDANYLAEIKGHGSKFVDNLFECIIYNDEDKAKEIVEELSFDGIDAQVCFMQFAEFDNPNQFTKKGGIFVIKYNDEENTYWIWDYFNKDLQRTHQITKDCLFKTFKDAMWRIKIDSLNAKTVEIKRIN